MFSRKSRRALDRANHPRITREACPEAKQTHRLPPQVCALWVPDECGYVVDFCPHRFSVADNVALARHYTEDEASSAALTFKEITGLRVAVRPVYNHQLAL